MAGPLIEGTYLDDILVGTSESETLYGGDGNDSLFGGEGVDRVDAGAGNDVLSAGGSTGSNSTEVLLGGSGDDTYLFDDTTFRATVMSEGRNSGRSDQVQFTSMGLSDFDAITIQGTSLVFEFTNARGQSSLVTVTSYANIEAFVFADGSTLSSDDMATIAGSATADILSISGAGGFLFGGDGGDVLYGGFGDDYLNGGAGEDWIRGGAGDDVLISGTSDGGTDVLEGGAGNDSYVVSAGALSVLIEGETALSGSADRVILSAGYASLSQVTLTASGSLLLSLEAADGSTGQIEIADYAGIESYEFADGTTLSADQMSDLIATERNDTIYGLDTGDRLLGLAGNDRMYGNDGDDYMHGGEGRDRLYGGQGNDTLLAGSSTSSGQDELLRGGKGDDTYIIAGVSGRTMVLGETATGGSADRVVFADWTLDDLVSAELASNGDLRLVFVNDFGVATRITLRDYQNIEQIEFADGFVLPGEHIAILATTGVSSSGTVDPTGLESLEGDLSLPEVSLGNITQMDGSAFAFAHVYHAPAGIIQQMEAGAAWTSASSTNGTEYVIGDSGNQLAQNLNSGGDIFFGNGGDDAAYGGNGADLLSGGAGADLLDGGTYSDVVIGGDGNDRLTGGAMNDVLFGGAGSDVLEGGFAIDVLFGGDGDDTIISRSDGGEPDTRIDGEPVVVVTDAIEGQDLSGAPANDALYGGGGADLFVFEFTLGAEADPETLLAPVLANYTLYDGMGTADVMDDIYTINGESTGAGDPRQIKLVNIPIDWMVVSGLNDNRHDHWMDGIGDDVIYDFAVGEDQIAFIGHTVEIAGVVQVDADGNGVLDTVVTLASDHTRTVDGVVVPLAHDNDLLGTVTLIDVQLTEADLLANTVDVPVHGGHMMMLTGDPMIDAYLLANYADENGALLPPEELVSMFGSFDTIGLASSYYSSNLATINTYADDVAVSQLGSDGADLMLASDTGSYLNGGAGADILLGSEVYAVQFGRDVMEGGAGNDLIFGAVQDDILFGGDGDDVILGGGVMEIRSNGTVAPVGDEDLIFGGAGHDILAGGPSTDWLDGGTGDDILLSASDIYVGDYVSDYVIFASGSFDATRGSATPRDFRTLDDLLIGGDGADTFVFDVLTSEVDGRTIQTSFGVDTIYDFDAAEGDSLQITVHGTLDSVVSYAVSAVLVDGIESAVINIISSTTDDLTTTDDPLTGSALVETDHTGSVGEILMIGVSASEAQTLLAAPDGFVLSDDPLGAAAYYEDILGF